MFDWFKRLLKLSGPDEYSTGGSLPRQEQTPGGLIRPRPGLRSHCVFCGGPMVAIRSTKKTCSDSCRKKLSRMKRGATTDPE